MIIRIIAAAICIFGGSYFFSGFKSKSLSWNAFIALLLAGLNGIIFAILRFLATPMIWIVFGLIGLILNFLLLLLVNRFITDVTIKNYPGTAIFSLGISLISGIIFWII